VERVGPAVVERWARRIGALPEPAPDAVAGALEATIRRRAGGFDEVAPPVDGLAQLLLIHTTDDRGVRAVRAEIADEARFPVAALEERFGPGTPGILLHAGSPESLTFPAVTGEKPRARVVVDLVRSEDGRLVDTVLVFPE
jgi:hypothetical protein